MIPLIDDGVVRAEIVVLVGVGLTGDVDSADIVAVVVDRSAAVVIPLIDGGGVCAEIVVLVGFGTTVVVAGYVDAVGIVVAVVDSSAAAAREASVVVVDVDTVVAVDNEIVVVAQVVAVGYGEEHNSC